MPITPFTTWHKPTLPVEQSDEPITAFKYANLVVSNDESTVMLFAFNGVHHSIEGTALCHKGWGESGYHAAPSVECTCGFYAVKERIAEWPEAAELEVELYGKVIVCERGYRAQKQRILSVSVPSQCKGFLCDDSPTHLYFPKPEVPLSFARTSVAYCQTHLPDTNRGATLGQIANRLGTEVRWM